MEITDDGAILPLTVVYVTTVSAVLICEAAKEIKPIIDYWNIYVNDVFYEKATNEGTDIEITHLYYRLLELARETEYQVSVTAVDTNGFESQVSNTVTFDTWPKF